MSASVDNKVVQMTFDNEQFERETRVTMKTLDKLRESLDLTDNSKSFDAISKSIQKVDTRSLADGIEKISVQFSALEVVAITAISKITNQVIDMGVKLAKSLSIDQITEGFRKYEDYTSSVQTIIAATEKSVEEVEYYMDRLNTFTDETSFRLVDMTNNIGKFTSNRVELDEAVVAMQGIATASALAGAKIPDASHAMEGFSKAIAKGKMDLQNWKWIETARMATAGFKEELIKAGLAEGELIETTNGIMTANEKAIVSVEDFNSALKEGWMTKNVMIRTLEKYGKFADTIVQISDATDVTVTELLKMLENYKKADFDLGEAAETLGLTVEDARTVLESLDSEEMKLGQQAFRAAQEAKTFSEAIEAVKDAVSTGWMNTFKLIFGNYDEAKKLWTDLAEGLYEVFAESGNARNQLLRDWKDLGGRDMLIKAFYNIAKQLNNIRVVFKEALEAVFPPMTVERLTVITYLFNEFVKALTMSEDAAEGLKKILILLLSPLKVIAFAIKGIIVIISVAVVLISSLINSILSAVNDMGGLFNSFVNFFGIDRFERLVRALSSIIGLFASLIEKIISFGSVVKTYIIDRLRQINFNGLGFKDKILDSIVGFFETLSKFKMPDVFGAVLSAFEGIRRAVQPLTGVFNTIISPIGRITTLFDRARKVFNETGESATRFRNIIDQLKNSLKGIGSISLSAMLGGEKGVSSSAIGSMDAKAIQGFSTVVTKSGELKNNIEKTSIFAKVLNTIFSGIKGLGSVISGVGNALKNFIISPTSVDLLSRFGYTLGVVKNAIVDFVKKVDPAKLVIITLVATIAYAVKQMGDMFRAIRNLTESLWTLVGAMSGMTAPGKGASYVIQALAKLVTSLTLSLATLSYIYSRDKTSILAAVAIVASLSAWLTAIVGVGAYATKFFKLSDSLGSLGKALAGVGGAILGASLSMFVLVKVLKAMEELDAEKVWNNVKVLGALGAGIAAFGLAVAKTGAIPSFGVSLSLIAFAFAIKQMVAALSGIRTETYQAIGGALIVVADMIGKGIHNIIESIKKIDIKANILSIAAVSGFLIALGVMLFGLSATLSQVSVKLAASLFIIKQIVDQRLFDYIRVLGSDIYTAITDFVTKLTALEGEEFNNAVVVIIAIVASLTGAIFLLGLVAAIMSKIGLGIAAGFIGFSVALYAVLGVIQLIQQFTQDQIDKAISFIAGFAVLVGAIVVFSAIAGGGEFLKAAAAMLLVGIALYPMIGVLHLLKQLVDNGIMDSILNISLILGLFVGFFALLSFISTKAKDGAVTIAAVAALIASLGIAIGLIVALGDDIGKALIAAGALAGLLLLLSVAIAIIGKWGGGKDTALILLSLSAALLVLAASIWAIVIIPIPDLVRSLGALGGAILALSAVIGVLGHFWEYTIPGAIVLAAASLAMLVFAKAIDVASKAVSEFIKSAANTFVEFLNNMKTFELGEMAKNIGLLALSLAGLGVGGAVLAVLTPALMVASGGITVFGKAAEVAAVGISALKESLSFIGDAVDKFVNFFNKGGIEDTAEEAFENKIKDGMHDALDSVATDGELKSHADDAFKAILAGNMNGETVSEVKATLTSALSKELIGVVNNITAQDLGSFDAFADVIGNVIVDQIETGTLDAAMARTDIFKGSAPIIKERLVAELKANPEMLDDAASKLVDVLVASLDSAGVAKTEEIKNVSYSLKDQLVMYLQDNPEALDLAADWLLEQYINSLDSKSIQSRGIIEGIANETKNYAIKKFDENSEAISASGEKLIGNFVDSAYAEAQVKAPVMADIMSWLQSSFASGVDSGTKEVSDAAAKIGDATEESLRDRTGVHSLSDKYIGIGHFVTESYSIGMLNGTPLVIDAAYQMGDKTKEGIEDALKMKNGESEVVKEEGEDVTWSYIDSLKEMYPSLFSSGLGFASKWGEGLLNGIEQYGGAAGAKVREIMSNVFNLGDMIDKTGWYSKDYETYDQYMAAYLKNVYNDEALEAEEEKIWNEKHWEFLQIKKGTYGKDKKSSGGGGGGGSKETKKAVEVEIKTLDKLVEAYKASTKDIDSLTKTYTDSIISTLGPVTRMYQNYTDELGQFGKGNIDLWHRPKWMNEDGSVSTVLSFSVNIDDKETLLPMVTWVDGVAKMFETEEEAIEHYLKTGEHLGIFDTIDEAAEYAEKLHKSQEWFYSGNTVEQQTLAAAKAIDEFSIRLYEAQGAEYKLENQQKTLAEAIALIKGETKEASDAAKELAKTVTEGATQEQQVAEVTAKVIEDRLKGIRTAFTEYKNSIRDAIQSSLGFFEAVKQNENTLTGDELLKNARDNMDLANEWKEGIKQLQQVEENGVKLVGDELINRLMKQGIGSKSIVDAMLEMTVEDLEEFNQLFIDYLGSGASMSDELVNGMILRGQTMTEAFVSSIDIEAGVEVMNEFGVESLAALGNHLNYEKGYEPGSHLTYGIARGIEDPEAVSAVRVAIRRVAEAAMEEFTEVTDENSPSKVFAGFGKFLDLGLAKGITDYSNEPVTAIGNLANTINAIGAYVNGTFEFDPVIRPTLDLSKVAEGARGISRMFNQNRGIEVFDEEGSGINNSKSGASYTFIQNNNSPKALSRIDIYRQTKNQFAYFKEVAGGI